MAKLARSTNGKKKMNKIVNLKIVVEKLQRSLSLVRRLTVEFDHHNQHQHNQSDQNDSSNNVPEDVKKGHFAVIAVDEDELKRFVVPLKCLTHPSFLKLLEQAAEEYGFDHDGALTVPCRPSEFERIWVHEQSSMPEKCCSKMIRIPDQGVLRFVIEKWIKVIATKN